MRKIETIWHNILNEALGGSFKHTQQDLALKYNYSLSTVNHALDVPSKIGAVRKESKFFVLVDFYKLLYYWASVRNLEKDIVYVTYHPGRISDIEGQLPAGSIYAGYTATKYLLNEVPADYDKVYCYYENIPDFRNRFPLNEERNPNIFVIRKPKDMPGGYTTLPQTFVDVWNMADWYAGDFTKSLEEKMHGILP